MKLLMSLLLISSPGFALQSGNAFKLKLQPDAFVEFLPQSSFLQCRFGLIKASTDADHVFKSTFKPLTQDQDGYFKASEVDTSSSYGVRIMTQNLGGYGKWIDMAGGRIAIALYKNQTEQDSLVSRVDSRASDPLVYFKYNEKRLLTTPFALVLTPETSKSLAEVGVDFRSGEYFKKEGSDPLERIVKFVVHATKTGLFKQGQVLGAGVQDCEVKVSVRSYLPSVIATSTGARLSLDRTHAGLEIAYREPEVESGKSGVIWGDIIVRADNSYTNRLPVKMAEAKALCEGRGARLPTRQEALRFAKLLGAGSTHGYSTKRLNENRDVLRGMDAPIWLASEGSAFSCKQFQFSQNDGKIISLPCRKSNLAEVRCVAQ